VSLRRYRSRTTFFRRANPVDVIYGAFPALLYFNSSIAADLLKPLLEFQSSSGHRNLYAAPDLGRLCGGSLHKLTPISLSGVGYPGAIQGNSTNTEYFGVESEH
jgi:hypothetical protein